MFVEVRFCIRRKFNRMKEIEFRCGVKVILRIEERCREGEDDVDVLCYMLIR